MTNINENFGFRFRSVWMGLNGRTDSVLCDGWKNLHRCNIQKQNTHLCTPSWLSSRSFGLASPVQPGDVQEWAKCLHLHERGIGILYKPECYTDYWSIQFCSSLYWKRRELTFDCKLKLACYTSFGRTRVYSIWKKRIQLSNSSPPAPTQFIKNWRCVWIVGSLRFSHFWVFVLLHPLITSHNRFIFFRHEA